MDQEIKQMMADLKAPFPHNLISWRVGATNAKKNNGKATKGIALAYIDARDVMERLDAVVGPENWQTNHPHASGKTSCRIGIRINGEWVWKENGAGDSNMDAEKGAFSDSFKRAAVLWGIGRYLYDVPNVWVDVEFNQIKNPEDPRLLAALRQAEGQPVADRKPTAQKPSALPAEEMKLLLEGIRAAKTLDDIASARDNATAAKPRMSKDQIDAATKEIKLAQSRVAQAPLQEAAE